MRYITELNNVLDSDNYLPNQLILMGLGQTIDLHTMMTCASVQISLINLFLGIFVCSKDSTILWLEKSILLKESCIFSKLGYRGNTEELLDQNPRIDPEE